MVVVITRVTTCLHPSQVHHISVSRTQKGLLAARQLFHDVGATMTRHNDVFGNTKIFLEIVHDVTRNSGLVDSG